MKKDYQKKTASAGISEELVLPDAVTVAMAEIGGAAKEGLLALAEATGLEVMEESVTAVAGPKGRHQPERTALRHGSEAGSVVLGGRRVPVRRPRVRAADWSGELPVEAHQLFASTDLLKGIALERMMAKLSTRRHRVPAQPGRIDDQRREPLHPPIERDVVDLDPALPTTPQGPGKRART